MSHRRAAALAAVASGALLAFAGTASAATTLKGTVVHRSKSAHSFVVAGARGHLSSVHSSKTPRIGRSVTVRARKLRNGTYAASRISSASVRRHARLRGTVTYVSRNRQRFVLSARGVSLVVHRQRARTRAADDTVPAPGTAVNVNATVTPAGDIEETDIQQQGADNTVDLEGKVVSVVGQLLTLTADDDDELQAATIRVNLPAGMNPAAFRPGDEVELVATLNPDGSFTAVGSSLNGDEQEADDLGDDQGDQGDDNGANGNGDNGNGDNGNGGD